MNSEEIAMSLLEGGVLCSPGTAFGSAGEGHLRFAYTISSDDISRGMDRVEKILAKLRGRLRNFLDFCVNYLSFRRCFMVRPPAWQKIS